MKNIQESLEMTKTIAEYINEQQVDEGFKEFVQTVKAKFKAAFEYLKGVVAKFGVYFLPVDKDGNTMNAISPLTAGAAYKEGYINQSNTLVVLDKAGQRITGLRTKYDDAKSLYGSGNSIAYWVRGLKECQDLKDINKVNEEKINEVLFWDDTCQSACGSREGCG